MRRLPDTFFFGVFFGIVSLLLSYLLVRSIRMLIVSYNHNDMLFAAPRVQLFAIVLNILVFRFVIVDLKKEKTGKGILFTTVLLSFTYFVLFVRYKFTAI